MEPSIEFTGFVLMIVWFFASIVWVEKSWSTIPLWHGKGFQPFGSACAEFFPQFGAPEHIKAYKGKISSASNYKFFSFGVPPVVREPPVKNCCSIVYILPHQKFGVICMTLDAIFHHLFSKKCQYFTYGENVQEISPQSLGQDSQSFLMQIVRFL